MKNRRTELEIVVRNGKPAAVILDLARYEELLERAEDTYDLARLRALRSKSIRYKTLDEFMRGSGRRV